MMTYEALDWTEILEKVSAYSTSQNARDEIQATGPLEKLQAEQSVRDIFDAMKILKGGIRPHMTSLDLYSQWSPRLKKKAVLKTLEIKDIRLFCLETHALGQVLRDNTNEWSERMIAELFDAERPLSAIDQILSPSGDIRADASEKLYSLYNEKERLARDVQSHLDKLVGDHQIENFLQDKFVTTREGRWVLPVRSGSQHFVQGVIHGSSQTKQTVFIEPEKIIPMNNRLRQIEVEIEDEIERLLTELSHYLHGLFDEFERTKTALIDCDMRFAQGQFSLLIDAQPFQFSEKTIELNFIKHPLMKLSGRPVISNNIQLNEDKSILLLSGPNAGGKTVLLKSIGLAAQMARCGYPLCADDSSKIPYFKNLIIAIGDSQSVDEELSTFAAHLKILNDSSRIQGPDNLILIDEICGSTDPEEGSALGRSFIEMYSKNSVFAVITSHLGPLKSGWTEKDRVLNGSLEYDLKSGRPTYQFLSGLAGDSLALQMAKRVGVDKGIIDRAIDLLSPSSRKRLESLEQIEQMKTEVSQLQSQLRKDSHKAQEIQKKYQHLIEDFEKEKDQKLQKVLKQSEKKIEEAISQARVEQTFKKHAALQEIKHQLPEIVKAKPGVQRDQNQIETAEEFSQRFPPGSKVFVQSLGQDGIVQSTPNSKGEVLILSHSMRLQVMWYDLRPAQKPSNPTAQIVRKSSGISVALVEHDRVLDLRGKTVDDSLEELEQALDLAVQNQEDRMKVIHGHGTEALKKSVRVFLSRSLYVKKWKAGTSDQGGDGITWVELGSD